MIIGAIGNGLNALLHYLLLYVVEMDYSGSAYSQAISFDLMGILSIGYVYFWKVYDNQWPGWGKACLCEWGEFMKLGIPSLLMICVESWTIEIGVFMAGTIQENTVVQQSAQSVLFQIQTITDMLTIGFGAAASIRVGQLLGKGDASNARLSAILSIIITITMALIIAIILISFRTLIPLLFITDDQEVIDICARLLPFLGLYAFTDALTATGAGIVRGCGRQLIGSIINVIGYYGLALPIGIPLLIVTQTIDRNLLPLFHFTMLKMCLIHFHSPLVWFVWSPWCYSRHIHHPHPPNKLGCSSQKGLGALPSG